MRVYNKLPQEVVSASNTSLSQRRFQVMLKTLVAIDLDNVLDWFIFSELSEYSSI